MSRAGLVATPTVATLLVDGREQHRRRQHVLAVIDQQRGRPRLDGRPQTQSAVGGLRLEAFDRLRQFRPSLVVSQGNPIRPGRHIEARERAGRPQRTQPVGDCRPRPTHRPPDPEGDPEAASLTRESRSSVCSASFDIAR